MALWIDDNGTFDQCGQIDKDEPAFLIESFNENTGRSVHYLSRIPAHTNQSCEPRLNGWCGTTDNRAEYARGLAKIVRYAKNGRAMLVPVEPTAEVLEELGYPELLEHG
jgi:hypothetical protein